VRDVQLVDREGVGLEDHGRACILRIRIMPRLRRHAEQPRARPAPREPREKMCPREPREKVRFAKGARRFDPPPPPPHPTPGVILFGNHCTVDSGRPLTERSTCRKVCFW
jgi:hypothetical protein